MIYKSERSQKTVLFSKLLQVFKSRASRIAGFHDTLHNHDKFSPFYICTNLIIAGRIRLAQSAGFQKFGIQHHAAWLPM